MRTIRLLCIAILVMLILGSAKSVLAADPKPTSDLALVPQDAGGFITLKVAGIWEEEIFKDLLKALDKSSGPSPVKDMGRMLGVDPKQVERLTVAMPASIDLDGNSAPLLILTATEKLDQDKIREAIVPKAEKKTAGDRVYYVDKRNGGLYFASERTMVRGGAKVLAEYMDKKLDITTDKRFKDAGDLVAKHSLVGMVEFAGYSKAIQKELPPDFKGTEALFDAKTAFFTLTADKDSTLVCKFTYKDADAAKDAEKAARKTLDVLAELCAQGQQEFKKRGGTNPIQTWATGLATGALTSLEDELKKAEVTRKDADLELKIASNVSSARLAGLVVSTKTVSEVRVGIDAKFVKFDAEKNEITVKENNRERTFPIAPDVKVSAGDLKQFKLDDPIFLSLRPEGDKFDKLLVVEVRLRKSSSSESPPSSK